MAKSVTVCFLILYSNTVIVGSVSPVFEQVRILERDVQQLKVEVPFLEQKLSNRLKFSEDAMLELIESKVKMAVSDALSGSRSRSRIRHVQGRDHHMKSEIRRLKEEVNKLKSDQESCEERISRVFTSETEHMSLLTFGLRRDLNTANEEIKTLRDDLSTVKNNIVYDYDEDDEYGSNDDIGRKLKRLSEEVDVLNRTHGESRQCNIMVNVSTDSDRMKKLEETLQEQAAQIKYLHAISNKTLQTISSNADQINNQADILVNLGEDFGSLMVHVNETMIQLSRVEANMTEVSRDVFREITVSSAPISMVTMTPIPPVKRTRILMSERHSSTSSSLQQLNIYSSQVSAYSDLRTNWLHALVYDPTRNQILFSKYSPAGIYSSPLDRHGIKTLRTNIRSYGMAVDPGLSVLFLTTYHPKQTVSRMTTNGRSFRDIIDLTRKGLTPIGVALDTKNKTIYMSSYYRLMSVTYEGKNFQTLYTCSGGSNYIYGLTLDERRGMLYFSHGHDIMRYSLSRGQRVTVGTLDSQIWSLVFHNDTIYISSDSDGNIHSLFTNDSNDTLMQLLTTDKRNMVICLIP